MFELSVYHLRHLFQFLHIPLYLFHLEHLMEDLIDTFLDDAAVILRFDEFVGALDSVWRQQALRGRGRVIGGLGVV